MALTATQKVTVAEIALEEYATIDALATSLITEQETAIIADIALWNANRNKLKVELDGDVKFKTTPLLEAIRMRTRKAFGLPLFSDEIQPTSGAIANVFVF